MRDEQKIKQIQVDIKILKFIREIINNYVGWLGKESKIESGADDMKLKSIRNGLEKSFVLQFMNIVSSFHLVRIDKSAKTENEFIGYSLFLGENKLVSYEDLIRKVNKRIVISFNENFNNQGVIQIPKKLVFQIFEGILASHHIIFNLFSKYKLKSDRIIDEFHSLWYEERERNIDYIYSIPSIKNKEKFELVTKIKEGKKKLGTKFNKKNLTGVLGISPSTFDDQLKAHNIKYFRDKKILFDLDNNEAI